MVHTIEALSVVRLNKMNAQSKQLTPGPAGNEMIPDEAVVVKKWSQPHCSSQPPDPLSSDARDAHPTVQPLYIQLPVLHLCAPKGPLCVKLQ